MKMTGVERVVAALVFCLAAAAVSGLLLLHHHGEGGAVAAAEQVCGDGESGPSGCETVAASSWSTFGGFPLAGLGVVFYLSLSLLLGLSLLVPEAQRPPLTGLVVWVLGLGLIVDLALLGVQAFGVGAFCTLCIATYVLGGVAFVALLPSGPAGLELPSVLGRPEARLALAGWALGTLATAAAVVSLEATLDHRESRRQLALLGTPAPAPDAAVPGDEDGDGAAEAGAVASEPEPSDSKDPAYWKERAEELQQTLDDPKKLERYFAQKAQKEFDAASVEEIDLHDVPLKGPEDAPVKVVEYSDFLCPFCRNLAAGLSQFVPQADGRVAVYFKNYPLDQECNESLPRSTHPGACVLARGAICAHRQGKFEAYHDRVFSAEGLRNPGPADVARLAGEAGLSAQAMAGCLEDPATAEALDRQIAEARRLEVQATPTIYVNGRKLPRINDLVSVVDKEAQKRGFPPLRH